MDGKKNGQGSYLSNTGYSYKGSYTNDEKTGKGSIFDSKNVLIYEGEVKNGLPHGKGRGLRDGKLI